MTPLLLEISGSGDLADPLCRRLGAEKGEVEQRRFPDGEAYVRIATPVEGRDVLLLCTLDRPDLKVLPLLFAADAARRLGARSVGLVAPYLAYMRQDMAFAPGEAVSSLSFAGIVSARFDWLATVDPHLHRHPSLDALYAIPAAAASAAGPIALWIAANVERPVLIGPDSESRQWVERIADQAGAPVAVLGKTRRGDRDVEIDGAGLGEAGGRTAVIVDDIASSAHTMIEAVKAVRAAGLARPMCIAVHGLFAEDGYERLLAAGPAQVATTNTVPHPTNRIDVSRPLAEAVVALLAARA